MTNIFTSLLNDSFKNVFHEAIDAILNQQGLAVQCRLQYETNHNTYCNNCIFDPILDRSNNRFNSTGPAPFADGSICPICAGYGKIVCDSNEIISMAMIFDSKYWMNWGPQFVNIPNLAAQSLCSIQFMPKILNCSRMNVINIENYDNGSYSKAGQPTPMGFGSHKYILTNWTRP